MRWKLLGISDCKEAGKKKERKEITCTKQNEQKSIYHTARKKKKEKPEPNSQWFCLYKVIYIFKIHSSMVACILQMQ